VLLNTTLFFITVAKAASSPVLFYAVDMQLQSPRTAISDKGVAWPSPRERKESQANSVLLNTSLFFITVAKDGRPFFLC
jgi:hypothetical protein